MKTNKNITLNPIDEIDLALRVIEGTSESVWRGGTLFIDEESSEITFQKDMSERVPEEIIGKYFKFILNDNSVIPSYTVELTNLNLIDSSEIADLILNYMSLNIYLKVVFALIYFSELTFDDIRSLISEEQKEYFINICKQLQRTVSRVQG